MDKLTFSHFITVIICFYTCTSSLFKKAILKKLMRKRCMAFDNVYRVATLSKFFTTVCRIYIGLTLVSTGQF